MNKDKSELDKWKPIFVNGVIPSEFKWWVEQERIKARIEEVKNINLRKYNNDPSSNFALPLGNYIKKRIAELTSPKEPRGQE